MAPNTTAPQSPMDLPGSAVEGANAKSSDPYFQNWWSQIVWKNVVYLALLHGVAAYGLLTIPVKDNFPTHVWSVFAGLVGGFGVTAGAHRLWTHRAYKAKTPLRIILAMCFSMAGENTIFEWVRDHRVHHKFSETDADPHNANRGFFFAHVGWLLMRKHPEVLRKGKQIDMSDVLADPVVKFHTKYFTELKVLFCFILPTIVPHYLWGETWYNSVLLSAWRYVLMLNANWLVNSAAHIWGYRPYDKRINPAENIAVAFLTLGEGWHNYHHVFPWDYRAAELGTYFLNMTTFYLDLFAKIGWAYDLKCPSQELVEKVAKRYGDGSHPRWGGHVQEILEEEDTQKKVLYPSADHLNDSAEDLDKILSEMDSIKDAETVPDATLADVSQSHRECDLPNDMESKGISHSLTTSGEIKDEKVLDPSRKKFIYKNCADKTQSIVSGITRYKNPMFSLGKTIDSKFATKNGLSRNSATPNGITRGKEAIGSHIKPILSYVAPNNGISRNETPVKKIAKYEASATSPEMLKTVNNGSTNYSKIESLTNSEFITENKSPCKVLSEQIFCTKDVKYVENQDKKIL